MTTIAILLGLALQEGETAAAVQRLEKAQAMFKDAKAIAFDEELVRVRVGHHAEDRSSLRCLVKRPNLLRLEIASKAKAGGHLVVLDGEHLWHLDREKKEFAKHDQDDLNTALHFEQRLAVSIFLGKAADDLRAPGTQDVKVGREKIQDAEFHAISWKAPRATVPHVEVEERCKLFLDDKNVPRRLVRRWTEDGVETTETTDYSNFDLAPKVDKETFTFTPPEGTRERRPAGPGKGR